MGDGRVRGDDEGRARAGRYGSGVHARRGQGRARDREGPARGSEGASPPPSAGVTSASKDEAWWKAARLWAGRTPSKLEGLVETAQRLERSRLSSLVAEAVKRLPLSHTVRLQETGRYALAILADEFLRALPDRYGELLEIQLVERHEIIKHDEVGRLWALLDPLFAGWARLLDPALDPRDKARIGKTLCLRGDILPWDTSAKGRPDARERAALRTIDAVYVDDHKDPEQARLAAYWAATIARNDAVHSTVRSLAGRVSPMELLNDVVALAALAAIRFRIRYAEESRSQASVPSISSAPLAAMVARLAAKEGIER